VNSTGSSASTSSKYDLDLLKSDVEHARARVQRLRGELANIGSEVVYQQRGVETLAQYVVEIRPSARRSP
jgi:protein KIBRA